MLGSDGIGAVYRKLRLCLGLFGHAAENGGVEDDEKDEEKRHRLRWYRRDFRRIVEVTTRALLLGIALLVTPGTRPLRYMQDMSISFFASGGKDAF
jgi:hypothetical protein